MNGKSPLAVGALVVSVSLQATTTPMRAGSPHFRKEPQMEIHRAGSQPSVPAPAEHFTGTVRLDQPFQAAPPARLTGVTVTFEPGARSDWHTHPLGQTLIVTSGCGLVQSWGSPIKVIRPGDVVWCPPGEKHWHGATPSTAMTHIAILEGLEGRVVDWMEKVGDEQYNGPREE